MSAAAQQRRAFCSACGAALPQGAERCDSCGEAVASPAAPAQTGAPREQRAGERAGGQRRRQEQRAVPQGSMVTMRLWQAAVAALLLFAAGASTMYLAQSRGGLFARGGASAMDGLTEEQAAAIRDLEERVADNPGDLASVLRLANLLQDVRRFEAAITRYRAYLAARPDDPDAQVDMGVCHFELRQYDRAIAAMREAVDRHPDHVQGNYNLGIVCMNAGRPRDAISWFTATLALHPREDIRANAQRYLDQLTRDTQ